MKSFGKARDHGRHRPAAGTCLNTTAEFWPGLPADYDLRVARYAKARHIDKQVHPWEIQAVAA